MQARVAYTWLSPLLLVGALAGCVSEVAREATERGANGRVGRAPAQAFKEVAGVDCGVRGSENGCLHTDGRDCRIWYTVDSAQGVITGWRYVGPRDNCSRLKHGG